MLAAFLVVACCFGCQSPRPERVDSKQPRLPEPAPVANQLSHSKSRSHVQLAAHQQADAVPDNLPAPGTEAAEPLAPAPPVETLADLEGRAASDNPTLRRMQQEAAAEWAKTDYVARLPDPTLGSTFYLPPMHYEPDRLVASVDVMQMIPWIGRLKAEAQQAHLTALASETAYQAERLRVIGDLRAAWFKLYVLGKQLETTQADQVQLESLIKTANARIRTGDSQPGDVLMATLELSSLQEQLLGYRQQVAATKGELNRLAGREAYAPLVPPTKLEAELPDWNQDLLREIALEAQPELNAARLRTAATRWGIEVARLKRRPDFTFAAGWMAMDAPGAVMPGAGMDSYTLGVTSTLPVSGRKYGAMYSEAASMHSAAHASEDEIALRLDAALRDLWEQARASRQTVELYETTILPQARQTFEADQKSLVNNSVTFDRVIRDYRTLLNLELGYHRALGQLATSLARIRQTIGVDLAAATELPEP